jgi:uncharacterized protein
MGQSEVIKILNKFRKALETAGIYAEKLILFGSYASGNEREDSDIDVVVVSKGFKNKNYWERIDILTEAVYRLFAPIEATAMTPEEWENKESLIADYAQKGIFITS